MTLDEQVEYGLAAARIFNLGRRQMTITKTMTVDQAKVEAEKLAKQFEALFDDFEAATGLRIDDIALRRPLVRQLGEREQRQVKLYIALPPKE